MKNGKWRMENGMCRKMKDSGIEWLGEVLEGWNLIPARNLFIEVKDKNVSGSETRQFSFRYGQIVDKEKSGRSDVSTEETITAYRIVTPDTIMINGLNLNYDFISQRVAIVKERGIITSAYLAVFPRKKLIDPAFAVYLFKGYDSKQVFHGHGSGIRKTLNFSDFKDIVTVCPPLPEQRKIAAYLDRACAKIDEIVAGTKQTIEEYKAWKASLIFEAVTGKCRIENGKCRMGGRKMRDSGIPWLGEVPEGWTIKRFKFVVKTLRKGNGITKDEVFADGEIACIRYGEIYSRYNFVAKECASRTNRRCVADPVYVERGDILFACTGELVEEIGKNILYDGYEPCIAGGDILVASHNEDPGFLNYYLNCHSSQFQKSRGKAKLKVVHARTSDIENIVVLLPSSVEQRTIADYLDKKCAAIDRVIAEKEALIADLEAYRKSLIFEVVTGKMAVA